MKYRKLTGIGVLCAVMLFAGASSVFATNEQPAQVQDADAAGKGDASDIGTPSASGEMNDAELKAEKNPKKDGTTKVIANGEDGESIYLEFCPDVEIKEGEKVTVKFDSPIETDGSSEWHEYSYFVDADGVSHIQNGAGQELEKDSIYELYTQNGSSEETDDNIQADCSSDEITEAVLVEGEKR